MNTNGRSLFASKAVIVPDKRPLRSGSVRLRIKNMEMQLSLQYVYEHNFHIHESSCQLQMSPLEKDR